MKKSKIVKVSILEKKILFEIEQPGFQINNRPFIEFDYKYYCHLGDLYSKHQFKTVVESSCSTVESSSKSTPGMIQD